MSNIEQKNASHDQMALEVARTGVSSYPQQSYNEDVYRQVSIDRVRIDANIDKKIVSVAIELCNHSSEVKLAEVAYAVIDGSTVICEASVYLTLEPGRTLQIPERSLEISNPHLWSPEDPYLYTMHIKVKEPRGEELDVRESRFGMRSIVIGDDLRLYLNGRPIYLRGNTWVPGYSTLPFEPSFCKKLFKELKKQGFNYIRHHSVVPPYDWYYDLADRIGLMMSIEMGFDLDRSRDLIERHYNHPSIIFWAGVNEVHNTGVKPEVQAWYKMVKEMDSSRPVYDCSGWGEYDRDTTDILAQHFGYEYPYLKFEDLYERYDYYQYNGSAKGVTAEEISEMLRDGTFKVDKPQIIHELQGNAQIYSDKTLVIDPRMRKLWEHHGFNYADWPDYVRVNQEFVRACYKINYEAARRADNQIGFELLTVADSVVEYNREGRGAPFGDMDITGTCDVLGESKPILVQDLPVLNGAHVVLIDTHSKPRALWNDENIEASVLISCFDYTPPEDVTLEWRLLDDGNVVKDGRIDGLKLKYPGVGKVTDLSVPVDFVLTPRCIVLEVALDGSDYEISNNWKFWVFPKVEKTAVLSGRKVLTNVKWVHNAGGAELAEELQECDLFITDKLGGSELDYLSGGGKLLVIQDHMKEGFSCTPTSYRHRMYHSWVGGHSMGVVVHNHPALGDFPHEGFNDLQFYQLIQSCNRLMLDDLPMRVKPILESVPSLEYNQSKNSGYLLELGVGEGKLIASGLRLALAGRGECTSTWLLSELISYCLGTKFDPEYRCSADELKMSFERAAERVWVTAGPPWYLYPADDLEITSEGWESVSHNRRTIIPAGGETKAWINYLGDGGWGYDEWEWISHTYSTSLFFIGYSFRVSTIHPGKVEPESLQTLINHMDCPQLISHLFNRDILLNPILADSSLKLPASVSGNR